jgi:hypothetical protein
MMRDIAARRRYAMSVVLNIVVFLCSGGALSDVHRLRNITPVMVFVLLLTATGVSPCRACAYAIVLLLLLAALLAIITFIIAIVVVVVPFCYLNPNSVSTARVQVALSPASCSNTSLP